MIGQSTRGKGVIAMSLFRSATLGLMGMFYGFLLFLFFL
jgi:hypothetical protein